MKRFPSGRIKNNQKINLIGLFYPLILMVISFNDILTINFFFFFFKFNLTVSNDLMKLEPRTGLWDEKSVKWAAPISSGPAWTRKSRTARVVCPQVNIFYNLDSPSRLIFKFGRCSFYFCNWTHQINGSISKYLCITLLIGFFLFSFIFVGSRPEGGGGTTHCWSPRIEVIIQSLLGIGIRCL